MLSSSCYTGEESENGLSSPEIQVSHSLPLYSPPICCSSCKSHKPHEERTFHSPFLPRPHLQSKEWCSVISRTPPVTGTPLPHTGAALEAQMHLVLRHKAQATEQSCSGRENTRREGDGWPATSPSPSQAAKVRKSYQLKHYCQQVQSSPGEPNPHQGHRVLVPLSKPCDPPRPCLEATRPQSPGKAGRPAVTTAVLNQPIPVPSWEFRKCPQGEPRCLYHSVLKTEAF